MNLETELPETLFNEMRNFLESNPDSDQHNFINSALTTFLFKNGYEERDVVENYLNDLFNQSHT